MRVGFFYPDYEGTGGFPRDWQRFALELGELDESVTVYSCHSAQQSVTHPNVDVKRFAGSTASLLSVPAELIDDADRLDILEIVGGYLPQNISVARLAAKAGTPYIYAPLGVLAPKIVAKHPLKKQFFIHMFLRKALERAAGVHVFSELERTWVAQYVKRPAIQTALGAFREDVPSVLDRQYLKRELNLPDTQAILLFLGRLNADWKGLTTLIDGFSLIKDRVPNATLVLIGPDEHGNRKLLASQIEKAHLSRRIFLLGPLYGPAKFSAMASADLFVHPSNYDIIPRSIREALTVGCPVLASEETQVGDILRSYGAGGVARVDPKAIGDAIVRLVADREALAAMRTNASRASRDALDWRQQALHLRDGYRELLEMHCTTS